MERGFEEDVVFTKINPCMRLYHRTQVRMVPSRLGLDTEKSKETQYQKHSTISASALVVHLHALDSHSTVIRLTPGGLPKCSGIPELLWTCKTTITPGLVTHTVFPEAICATNSNVQDEVELLIEGRIAHAGLRPSIEQSGLVGLILAEVSTVPHVSGPSGELDEENLLQ